MIKRRHPPIDGDFEIRDAEKQVGGLAARGSRRRRAAQSRALLMGIEPGHRVGVLVEQHVPRVLHAALRELRVERRRREPGRGAVAIDKPLHAQLDGVVRRAPAEYGSIDAAAWAAATAMHDTKATTSRLRSMP